jgi:hypothetical protein
VSDVPDIDEVHVARLMLFVFDVFYPDPAMDFRSRRAKPLQCKGFVDGVALSVECRTEPPARSAAERSTQTNYARAPTSFADALVRRHAPANAADIVYQITDDRSSMAVPLSVLRQWRADYLFEHAMTLAYLDSAVVQPEPGFAGTIVIKGDAEFLDSLHFTFDSSAPAPRPPRT